MQRYLENREKIWTKGVMARMESAGLLRKSLTQIYSEGEVFKLGILWEYDSPAAFKRCQIIIQNEVLPHFPRYAMKTRVLRGIPIEEWMSNRYKTTDRTLSASETQPSDAPVPPGGKTDRPEPFLNDQSLQRRLTKR